MSLPNGAQWPELARIVSHRSRVRQSRKAQPAGEQCTDGRLPSKRNAAGPEIQRLAARMKPALP